MYIRMRMHNEQFVYFADDIILNAFIRLWNALACEREHIASVSDGFFHLCKINNFTDDECRK